MARRDRRGVNAAAQALIASGAALGASWKSIAQVLLHNGECRGAIAAISRYADAQGGTPSARLEQVFVLERSGRVAEARALLETLPPGFPTAGERAFIAGALDTMRGRLGQALDELTVATEAKPSAGAAWLGLAMAANMADHSELADRIIAADPARTGKPMERPGNYLYALGKVQADRGDHASALAAFTRGAAEVARTVEYDPRAEEEDVRRIIAGFDHALVERLAATVARPTARPIVVTGNPRSGTTLAAQVLTAHSAVATGDELALTRIIAEDTGGVLPEDIARWLAAGGSGDDLAALYLHLLDERFDQPGRIVDKTLGASRTLGLLAGMLPEAPLIWMRRQPIDGAWSCFRTYFEDSNPWSWSFATIAHHFNLEDRLLAHWQGVLGKRLLVIDYEALATAPEAVIPTMLAHCGLPVEPAVFTPETAETTVRTASVAQVRRPISRVGIGVAAPYRDAMADFIAAYAG